ncbi:MAG TPA: VOC family protein [Pusillimonas sp.]|uniref:VOC family protein n=1 Tax=unclassified Pusillimonas TaxID=2640016 RepID=UPI00260AFCAA|nr:MULTISPECIES: VOC family protein [unclassified Pusillimonas]HLU18587.1 VOC family protein [Pusillimonas sp.]
MRIEPYLFFDGRSEEAMMFYEQTLGAEREALMRYSDCPEPMPQDCLPPGGLQKVLHGSLLFQGQRLMFSDGSAAEELGGFRGFSLTLQYDNEEEARQAFDKLADQGQVVMPLGPTFFSPCYGMLSDRFGVQWMVMVTPPNSQPS